MSAHVILHLLDIGLDLPKASTVVPVFALVGLGFQMMGGLFGDRVDKRLLISLFLAIQASAVIILAFAESYATALSFAVLWGIGFGGRTPILHAMRGDYFGTKAFGTILGLSGVSMGLAMMSAPVAVGYLFDLQGTYRWALIGAAAACYAGSLLILFATRPTHPSERSTAQPASVRAGLG